MLNKCDNKSLPLVSIIIPCFNADKYISRCIQSALNQDYKNLEVIVVNDGSTDSSLDIISSFPDITIYNQKNSGACTARNLGLYKSNGKYIKFLDSDDYLEQGAVSSQVDFCEKLKPKQIGYGYKKIRYSKYSYVDKMILQSNKQFVRLINSNIVITLPLHKRSDLLALAGFDEKLDFRQEWDLHLRLAHKGFTFIFQDECIFTQVIHAAPHRISCRKLNVNNEMNNLNNIRKKFGSGYNDDTRAAWAHKYWTLGRQFLKEDRNHDANIIFSTAKRISPEHYLSLYPLPYRMSVSIVGAPISEKMIKTLKLLKERF